MRRFLVRFLLSLLVGAGFAYLAFRDMRWDAMAEAFAAADYLWLFPFFGSLALVQLLRAWRWVFLLEPIAPKMPSTWRVLTVSWVGFMAIIALPLRLGEVVRPYLISDPASRKGDRLRMSAALGTIAVERVVDGLVVSLFLFVVFLSLDAAGKGTTWMMATGWTALGIFGGAVVFLALAMWQPRLAVSTALILSLVGPLAKTGHPRLVWLEEKVSYVLDGIIQGFRTLGRPGLLAKYVAVSLVYWVFNGLSFYTAARAFHLGLPVSGAMAVCGLVAIGITLPTGPALVGNFHEFGKLGLLLYLPKAKVLGAGMAFLVLVHGLQLVWYVGVGLVVLAGGWVSFRKVMEAAEQDADQVMDGEESEDRLAAEGETGPGPDGDEVPGTEDNGRSNGPDRKTGEAEPA